MTVMSAGISRIGGKYRLRKELLNRTPYHESFLSLFTGASWYELSKPRCRYECFNDKDAELINYLLQVRKHPKEFDEIKQGVLGLVSQDICNRIVQGRLRPENDLERAYFFYYLNKLTYGGSVHKVGKKPPYALINSKDSRIDKNEMRDAKKKYEDKQKEYKTKGYGLFPTEGTIIRKKDIKKAKASFGLFQDYQRLRKTDANKGKEGYRQRITEYKGNKQEREDNKEKKASYKGIAPSHPSKTFSLVLLISLFSFIYLFFATVYS